MAEINESARRWSGFVCPDCRFIFRVPRNHDGVGIICPSCRRMLRIPAPGEATPLLVDPGFRQSVRSELHRQSLAVPADDAESLKRQRAPRVDEIPDWEKQLAEPTPPAGNKVVFWMLVGGGGILVATLGFLGVVMFLQRTPTPVVKIATDPAPSQLIEGEKPPSVDMPEIMIRGDASFSAEAERITREFLEADTVEKMLPLVRNVENAEGRIRTAYPDGKIVPLGLSSFNPSGVVAYRGNVASVSVTTREYESRQIAYVSTPQGLKIDWESFAGWSDVPWEEFMGKRPAKPQIFRVKAQQSDYYNFDFSDESKWRCYRLASPDGNHVLYGYAKLGPPEDTLLRPDQEATTLSCIVALKFQPGSASGNQVIIDRFVNEGWVEDVKDK